MDRDDDEWNGKEIKKNAYKNRISRTKSIVNDLRNRKHNIILFWCHHIALPIDIYVVRYLFLRVLRDFRIFRIMVRRYTPKTYRCTYISRDYGKYRYSSSSPRTLPQSPTARLSGDPPGRRRTSSKTGCCMEYERGYVFLLNLHYK
jgi:hypothetical protein